jgi:cobalt-zinc-cadmium efflux system protein
MHDHSHKPSKGWVVKAAVVVTLGLVATEFVMGHLAHSLALVSDGWHNLTDVPTLIFSWLALYLERKPPDHRKTYGYQRAGVLAAFVNGLILMGVSLFICFAGYERIVQPGHVATGKMLVVGIVALVINGGVTLGLGRERRDLNLRVVFVHYLGDALSNVGIIAGAFLIRYTGQPLIDPLLAFLIAGMIFWGALGVITESSNILLESLPKGMSLDGIANTILRVPGVREVHDVHVWSLGSESHAMSCHVHILDMATSENEKIAHQIRKAVASDFGITHTTIQFEHQHEPGKFHKYMPEPVRAAHKK